METHQEVRKIVEEVEDTIRKCKSIIEKLQNLCKHPNVYDGWVNMVPAKCCPDCMKTW